MIGKKLETWLLQKFGNINQAGKALETPPITIHRYISEENLPGTPFLIKLQSLGCDLNWLLSETEGGQGPPVKRDNEKEELEAENRALKEELAKVRTFISGAAALLPKLEEMKKVKRKK